jgi:hypothetical protein
MLSAVCYWVAALNHAHTAVAVIMPSLSFAGN